MRTAFALFLTLCTARVARAAVSCGDTPVPNDFQIGLSLQILLPNNLPDFSLSVPAYGIVASVPLGRDSIQVLAQYGSGEKFYLYSGEVNYALVLPTPFFTPFLLAGIHWMHYALSGVGHDNFGGNAGIGLLFPLSSDFQITLGLKSYLESRAIIAFGGGFSFFL